MKKKKMVLNAAKEVRVSILLFIVSISGILVLSSCCNSNLKKKEMPKRSVVIIDNKGGIRIPEESKSPKKADEEKKISKKILEPEEPEKANKSKIHVLLAQARVLYQNQKYMKAKTLLEQVLIRDPYNDSALKMLDKIYKVIYKSAKLRRNNELLERQAEVLWKWNEPVLPCEEIAPSGTATDHSKHGSVLFLEGHVKGNTSGKWEQSAGSKWRVMSPKKPAFKVKTYSLKASLTSSTNTDSMRQQKKLNLALANADEVWIISKSDKSKPDGAKYRTDLVAKDPKTGLFVPIPLEHTAVTGNVTGYIAEVQVKQQYKNPFSEKIEATYVFPLPQNAAVTDFIMTVGERKIRGIIRERKEAEKIYEEAKRQGYRASLMTQERPNIFTQKVANIEPGKRIDIDVTYYNTLNYSKGVFEFVFPMVVGPRFNPPGAKNPVRAQSRAKGAQTIDDVAVTYLAPTERSGHTISLDLIIDGGVAIEKISSPTHAIKKNFSSQSQATISLAQKTEIPNKDFILRYQLAGKTMKSALMLNKDPEKKAFTLMLVPPKEIKYLPRQPQEMIFVVDCSGSMSGRPLTKAKEAMRYCLKNLTPQDSFQIMRFSDQTSSMGSSLLPGTPENIEKGLEYIDNLHAGGGTYMMNGIKAALNFPANSEKLRIISFMTDGYIGNEREIFRYVQQNIGSARIFSFGIGGSVNRYLLTGLASLGNGAAAFIGLHDNAMELVDQFYDRCSRPALTNIKIDWNNFEPTDVFPKQLPDLFVGRPVLVTGKYNGIPDSIVKVSGLVGGKEKSYNLKAENCHSSGIHFIWARQKLKSMRQLELIEPSESLKNKITEFSIQNKVLSTYTAFLAVDSSERTKGKHGYAVKVPVPMPEGVKYETTVD